MDGSLLPSFQLSGLTPGSLMSSPLSSVQSFLPTSLSEVFFPVSHFWYFVLFLATRQYLLGLPFNSTLPTHTALHPSPATDTYSVVPGQFTWCLNSSAPGPSFAHLRVGSERCSVTQLSLGFLLLALKCSLGWNTHREIRYSSAEGLQSREAFKGGCFGTE